MKRIAFFMIVIVLLGITVCLSGCSTNMAGKYVSVEDSRDYIVLDKKTASIFSDNNYLISGKYSVRNNVLTITFDKDSSLSDVNFNMSNSKETIYMDGTTLIKESASSGLPWWGWVLLISVGYGIISIVYKAITKRDLDEDIDELTEKLDDL